MPSLFWMVILVAIPGHVLLSGANLLNVDSFWQQIITGALIAVIVYFDQFLQPRR